ncbi:hypothetical protein [uncultured Bdellovibrio sp.]|uniref:hypothetical protein n=1 Tax=Bdellovibrio sp. HCB-162 TaxID=3394234 RepID=UPI0025DBEEC1|nr:hypothetical protein [uncultured Bdellovibrio sp.]
MKFGSSTFAKLVVTVMVASMAFGCAKKEEEEPSLGSGGLTAAQLAGTRYSSCVAVSSDATFGAAFNGTSYMQGLTFNADGSYALSTFWFTGANCQMGGSPILTYSQAGVFQVGEIMDTPAGATKVVMTVGVSQMTTYGGTAGASQTWAGYFNGAPGSPGFSTSANDTKTVSGWQALKVTAPDFSLPTFPTTGDVLYNAVTLDTSSTKTSVTSFRQTSTIWSAGQPSSYPTTSDITFTEP